jgi:hypothetical protein
VLLAFAALCPLVERTLGDIFTCVEAEKESNAKLRRKPPPLIKDLLQTDLLKEALGEDVLFVLQVLIGSPRALNLRNIIWHGFAASHEVHHGYYWILMLVFLDIFERGFPSLKFGLVLRPLKDLSVITPAAYDFGLGIMSLLHAFDHETSTRQDSLTKNHILDLIQNSSFVLPGRHNLIAHALDYFIQGEEDPYSYYFCLVLLLPALEHCLRVVWVSANTLPSELLCADSYRYYTIIDMFMETSIHDNMTVDALTTVTEEIISTDTISSFSPSSPSASSQNFNNTDTDRPNSLLKSLGIPILTALQDNFLYPLGPRTRDRISHGDVEPRSITKCAAARCLELFLALAMNYLPSPSNLPSSSMNLSNIPATLSSCRDYYDSYVACWHPHALLQRQLCETTHSVWRNWKISVHSIPTLSDDSVQDESSEDVIRRRPGYSDEMQLLSDLDSSISLKLASINVNSTDILQILCKIDDEALVTSIHPNHDSTKPYKLMPFDSLFCDSSTASTLENLRNMAKEVHSILELWNERFLTQKAQVESKQASSRLAATFYKQLAVLDVATLFFSVILRFIESGLHIRGYPQKILRKVTNSMAQLKQKVTQNTWDESVAIITSTVTTILLMVS